VLIVARVDNFSHRRSVPMSPLTSAYTPLLVIIGPLAQKLDREADVFSDITEPCLLAASIERGVQKIAVRQFVRYPHFLTVGVFWFGID